MATSRKRRIEEDDECVVVKSTPVGSTSVEDKADSRRTQRPSLDPAEQARPKRHQIATACTNCRDAKLRCSGRHPTCARCENRGRVCVYDVTEEGVTRREFLRRRYHEQSEELERAMAVLDQLQAGTDSEAAEILARLRLGDSIDQVYRSLHEIRTSVQRPVTPPGSAFDLPSPTPRRGTVAQSDATTTPFQPPLRSAGRRDTQVSIESASSPTSPGASRSSQGTDSKTETPEVYSRESWPNYLDPALNTASCSYPQWSFGQGETMDPRHASRTDSMF